MRNHAFIKRIAAILMAALMLAGTATACGGGNTPADTTALPGETTAAQTEPEVTEIPDNLPDDLDFGGRHFRIGYMAPASI